MTNKKEWEQEGMLSVSLLPTSTVTTEVTGGEKPTNHPSPKDVFGTLGSLIQLSSCYYLGCLSPPFREFHLPMKVKILKLDVFYTFLNTSSI